MIIYSIISYLDMNIKRNLIRSFLFDLKNDNNHHNIITMCSFSNHYLSFIHT